MRTLPLVLLRSAACTPVPTDNKASDASPVVEAAPDERSWDPLAIGAPTTLGISVVNRCGGTTR